MNEKITTIEELTEKVNNLEEILAETVKSLNELTDEFWSRE